MGARASKVGVEEVRNASPNALANAFAELSDSEREWPNEWAMAVLPTVNVSADPKACCSLSFVPRLLKLFSTFNRVNQMMFQWGGQRREGGVPKFRVRNSGSLS